MRGKKRIFATSRLVSFFFNLLMYDRRKNDGWRMNLIRQYTKKLWQRENYLKGKGSKWERNENKKWNGNAWMEGCMTTQVTLIDWKCLLPFACKNSQNTKQLVIWIPRTIAELASAQICFGNKNVSTISLLLPLQIWIVFIPYYWIRRSGPLSLNLILWTDYNK